MAFRLPKKAHKTVSWATPSPSCTESVFIKSLSCSLNGDTMATPPGPQSKPLGRFVMSSIPASSPTGRLLALMASCKYRHRTPPREPPLLSAGFQASGIPQQTAKNICFKHRARGNSVKFAFAKPRRTFRSMVLCIESWELLLTGQGNT
jgi:hypothetical protein